MAEGLIVAAPASGSGKTVVTLGLLRALRNRGLDIGSAKVGPDYIDPCYHEAATGHPSVNIDGWAMAPDTVRGLLAGLESRNILIEGVMGLFDGPEEGEGSTADIARMLNVPVVLVIDASHQAQSVAALVRGFATHRQGVSIAGVIFNRVASQRHADMLRRAMAELAIPVLGAVMRNESLALPSRHLGLVQAREHDALDTFVATAARIIAGDVDLDALLALMRPLAGRGAALALPPLGSRIAIARDDAFAFLYPHIVRAWRNAGAEIGFFSPLADETPDAKADAIFLPGGYPELHAGKIAAAKSCLGALAKSGALIYGECGGFMVLGDYLVDAAGARHAMAGLLPLGTSFAARRRQLGYRRLFHGGALPFPPHLRGHEFHYSTIDWQGDAAPLFHAEDAAGRSLGPMGLQRGRVMGSYAHVIA